MLNNKTFIVSQLIVILFVPISLWANGCEQATLLVQQAYQFGSSSAQQKALLQRALHLCPQHAQAHNNLGVVYENQGNFEKALYHYRQTLTYRPDYFQAWVGIGDVYYQQRQLPLSLEAYLHACTRHPRARQRVTELLQENRYRTVKANEVMPQESLALLYDKQRLQNLYPLATACQRQFKSLAAPGATKAFWQPISVFHNLRFKTGHADLSLISETQLDEIALTLLNHNATTIHINGHSDIQPWQGKTAEQSQYLNWQLSQKRADSVKNALVQRGISGPKLTSKGYGASRPLAKGNNQTAWAKNRRVEIEVIGQ